jgi:hypothetical protein
MHLFRSIKQWFRKEEISRPADIPEFTKFMVEAYEYLNQTQEICKNQYKIGTYDKWSVNQRTGLLTFSTGDKVMLRITVEYVGSFSNSSGTWLWAWANQRIAKKVKTEIFKVLEYGKSNNYEKLIKKKWLADEYDGWEMTAVAAFILKAKGAYRFPFEEGFAFIIFKEIETTQ